MSTYKDMAHDAGYRGDEADQVAELLEDAQRKEYEREQQERYLQERQWQEQQERDR